MRMLNRWFNAPQQSILEMEAEADIKWLFAVEYDTRCIL
jgi:hypothetical protein